MNEQEFKRLYNYHIQGRLKWVEDKPVVINKVIVNVTEEAFLNRYFPGWDKDQEMLVKLGKMNYNQRKEFLEKESGKKYVYFGSR